MDACDDHRAGPQHPNIRSTTNGRWATHKLHLNPQIHHQPAPVCYAVLCCALLCSAVLWAGMCFLSKPQVKPRNCMGDIRPVWHEEVELRFGNGQSGSMRWMLPCPAGILKLFCSIVCDLPHPTHIQWNP